MAAAPCDGFADPVAVAPAEAEPAAVPVFLAVDAPFVVVAGNRVSVVVILPPLMISAVADGESEMVVPDTVITPPGVRVCPPITNVVPPPGRAVYVAVPIVKSGGFVMGAVGISVVVTPFTTTAVAPGDREIVVPATVITPPGVRAEPPIK